MGVGEEREVRRTDTESVNEGSSSPKYCWRRADLESPESFVRGKRKSTSEGCEH